MPHSTFSNEGCLSIGGYLGAKLERVGDLMIIKSGPVVYSQIGDEFRTSVKKGKHKGLSMHIKKIERLLKDLPNSKGYEQWQQ